MFLILVLALGNQGTGGIKKYSHFYSVINASAKEAKTTSPLWGIYILSCLVCLAAETLNKIHIHTQIFEFENKK